MLTAPAAMLMVDETRDIEAGVMLMMLPPQIKVRDVPAVMVMVVPAVVVSLVVIVVVRFIPMVEVWFIAIVTFWFPVAIFRSSSPRSSVVLRELGPAIWLVKRSPISRVSVSRIFSL